MTDSAGSHHLLPTRIVRWSQEAGMGVDGAFDTLVAERAIAHVRHATFPIAGIDLEQLAATGLDVAMSTGSGSHLELLAGHEAFEATVIKMTVSSGFARVSIAAPDIDDVEACRELLIAALRDERQHDRDMRVPLHFWTSTPHGPMPMRRLIDVPSWEEITANYPAEIAAELDRAMHAGTRAVNGIALWQGEPGTGKTTALRALAHAWREWCDVHVIVDPEIFLGEQAAYLMNVLFSFQDMHHDHPSMGDYDFDSDYDSDFDSVDGPRFTQGWTHGASHGAPFPMGDYEARMAANSGHTRAKLLVLEDAGELISSDARASAGQALSRLLNVTDGILGQGANISVLVTTNEQVEDLHPAIARPGRCWSHIEFEPFTAGAGNEWLAAHDTPTRLGADRTHATLAELYSVLHDSGSGAPFDELRP